MIHGIGKLCLDYLMTVDMYPEKNSLVHIVKNEYSMGGMVANALKAADHFKSPSTIYSYMGTDPYGMILAESLEKTNIIGDRLIITEETDFSNIIICEDSRAIMSCRAIKRKKDARDFDLSLEKGDVLLIDCTIMEGIADLLVKAKESGVRTVMDMSTANLSSELDSFFPFVDYLIPSYDWASRYSGEGDPVRINRFFEKKGSDHLIITDGGKDLYYFRRGEKKVYRPEKISVKNSNGAGDTFHGAFCHGIHKGWSEDKAIRFSMAAASRRCLYDDLSEIPCEEDILHLL